MALWGTNDAKGSGGTVSLNYTTRIVTGSGTSFGQVGAAATGDVIRFGSRTGTYYGDAVIVGIASTTQLTIASTSNLNGIGITNVSFDISELPKYTTFDDSYSQLNIQGNTAYTTTVVQTSVASTANSGVSTVSIASTSRILLGDTFVSGSVSKVITSIGATTVSFGSTIASTLSAGSDVSITRQSGTYSRSVSGVANGGIEAAQTTKFALTHQGWVGITTYINSEGELRVKTETLVAMSGITTGNTP
ncbi:MAG: hypothetical protein ACO3UU_13665, partial [Minisyncoccia bacterium]